MIRNIYGLDLGTYDIKVYDKKHKEFWKEKSVIAIRGKDEILAVGEEAYTMYERAPQGIRVVFPMLHGVIAYFDYMQFLLETLLKSDQMILGSSEYLIAVPTDVTEVEKKAFYDLVYHSSAKAKTVRIVERGIADALGADVDIFNTDGVFVVNMGGGTTEMSVMAKGGMVVNKLLKIGGESYNTAIINSVRHNLDFVIGHNTAEQLRNQFDIFQQKANAMQKVAGRDLMSGIPQQKDIPISIVRASIKDILEQCVEQIQFMLERIPPLVRKSVERDGIYLTGGFANLKGLDHYLQEVIGLPIIKVEEPELCAIRGLGKMITNKKEYKKLTYSMLDEDYRWLR